MTPSSHPASRTAVWLGWAFVLLASLGVGTAWFLARLGNPRPARILLVTPAEDPGCGLDAFECRALGSLVQDHLECYGRFAVTSVTSLPQDLDPLRVHPSSRVLVLLPRRLGSDLSLGFRLVQARAWIRSGASAWQDVSAPFQAPLVAFEALDRALGLDPPDHGAALTPREPAHFWALIHAMSLRLQNDRLSEALDLAEQVARNEPGCASGWMILGNLRYRRFLNDPQAFQSDQMQVEALFRKALAIWPGHPRAAFLLSLLKSDSGDQREALEQIFAARRLQPYNPTLLTGLAYAARGAGLLPLARRAMRLRDSLAFSRYLPQAVDITYLYTGEIDRFEATLRDEPGHLRNMTGVLPFYRGYLALVRGDRNRAQREFESATAAPRGYPNIVKLARIYDLILTNRTPEAWRELRAFDQERTGMREPDGEFTIRLAEAYALMGDRASAMDMAVRAFGRGFGCTRWYEASPMLAPLRGLPRWRALVQHLQERQALMESAFPSNLVEDPS